MDDWIKVVAKRVPVSLREKLAFKFVWLARKIYPKNHAVSAFCAQVLLDQMITGKAIVRVDPLDATIVLEDKV